MKINKLFMGLAAMAFVGCSSDDLNVIAPEQTVEDARLVELDPNFVIAGVGAEASGTRTHWEQDPTTKALVNKFLPTYTASATFTATLDNDADLTAQAVGLCWLGQGAVGTDVYTNYEFYHFGWLNNGETNANFECGNLTNGSLYSEITMTTGTPSAEAKPGTDWTVTGLLSKSVKAGVDNLNYNSGVYKTDNKSIFGGQYIVYYPFNEDFKNAGTIPAKAETTFNNVSTSFDTPELGKATFRYSSPVTIEGGSQASDFGLYNLSTLVQLRVACPKGDAAIGQNIDQIVLWSESESLLKQANLAADKIVAGAKGEALYADKQGTKTIVANFAAPVALDKTDGVVTSAYITVLPTTVKDLKALVHNSTNGTWAIVDLANTVFEAGKAKRLNITVSDADFTADYIAVDPASLMTAVNEARAALALDATLTPTIKVIGNITLLPGWYFIDSWGALDEQITIEGDDIIIPEDAKLSTIANIESDIRVLGKSCCTGANGGQLFVQGGTVNNVTMEPTEADATVLVNNPRVWFNGPATVAAGKTFDVQAGQVEVYSAVEHKGNIQIAKDAKLIVFNTGDLNFMGSTVENNGTIEVEKDGKYDMTDADGNATSADGKRMTNNGKFIHNVDAVVGTAVQSMQQKGEYRCKVDDQIKLDDAFLQWTACSVIEMVNASGVDYDLVNACQHNGKYIDFEVNATAATSFANPTPDNKEINIGKLTVKSPFAIDFTNTVGTTIGKRTLTVNGNMAVKANTNIKDSKQINIKKNLTIEGAWVNYTGGKWVDGSLKNEALTVTGDITVSGGAGDFNAADVDALNITCANFYLKSGAQANFGNRTTGDAKNMTVSGTITNPAGCSFNIVAANQDGNGSVLAWISCKELIVGGAFPGGKPRVE